MFTDQTSISAPSATANLPPPLQSFTIWKASVAELLCG